MASSNVNLNLYAVLPLREADLENRRNMARARGRGAARVRRDGASEDLVVVKRRVRFS